MSKNKPLRDRNARLLRVLRNFFRNEVIPEATNAEYYSGREGMRRFLQNELRSAAIGAGKGFDWNGQIESIVRAEVGKALAGMVGYGPSQRWDEDGRSRLKSVIRDIVRDEVRKLVADSITIEATIKGAVHQPAKGARAIRLEDAD